MPTLMPDAWWSFSLDPSARADAGRARLTDDAGRPLVNPPGEGGRLGLRYAEYLELDSLVGAGAPASTVPDERAFLVIHQLCEVAFKLMTFDLTVVARTMEALLEADEARFRALIEEPLPDDRGPDPFWRPAMTAAARLRHTARRVLPSFMPYVGIGDHGDVLFSSLEYALFRDFLAPASGFQSAQLRLIQRALGRGPLFDLPVFPGDTISRHYRGCPAGHMALTDDLFLGQARATAYPGDDAPPAAAARLDDLAHAVLARVGDGGDGDAPPVREITSADVERVVGRFRATLGPDTEPAPAERFRQALEDAAATENRRRADLAPARRGAGALLDRPPSCLSFVLDRIAMTDAALHGQEARSFMSVHRRAVRRHVPDDSGTGGGGMPYLVTSQRFLLPLFPALVAYADLAEGLEHAEDSEAW